HRLHAPRTPRRTDRSRGPERARTSLARRRTVGRAVPPERRLAEPCSRGDDRARTRWLRDTAMKEREAGLAEGGDSVGVRLDVVHERHAVRSQLPFELGRVDVPREVDPRHRRPTTSVSGEDHVKSAMTGSYGPSAGVTSAKSPVSALGTRTA